MKSPAILGHEDLSLLRIVTNTVRDLQKIKCLAVSQPFKLRHTAFCRYRLSDQLDGWAFYSLEMPKDQKKK